MVRETELNPFSHAKSVKVMGGCPELFKACPKATSFIAASALTPFPPPSIALLPFLPPPPLTTY